MLPHIITAAIVLGAMIYSIDWVLRNKTEALDAKIPAVDSARGTDAESDGGANNATIIQERAPNQRPLGTGL